MGFAIHWVRKSEALFRRYSYVNIVMADQVMVSAVNFLTGVLQARFMGLQDFGRFSLGWMIILFVIHIQSSALISPMMSIGPKLADEEKPEYYASAVLQALIFSLTASFAVYVFVLSSRYLFPVWGIEELAFPIAFATLCQISQEFVRRYFYTVDRYVDAFVSDAISYLGQIALLIYLFYCGTVTTETVFYIMAFTSLASLMLKAIQLKSLKFETKAFVKYLKRHASFSGWLTASSLAQWISSNFMLLLASSMLGPASIGIIKGSQNVLGLTHVLFNGMSNIIPVKAAQAFKQGGLALMERYFYKASLVSGSLTLLMTLPALLAPDITLKLIYGKTLDYHQDVLFFFVFVYLLLFINQTLGFALRVLEVTKPMFVGYLISAVISAVVGYPLVAHFKVEGVVFGLIISSLVNILTLLISYKKCRRFFKTNG